MLRECYGRTVFKVKSFLQEKNLQKNRSIPEKTCLQGTKWHILAFVGIDDDLATNDDEYGRLVVQVSKI